jgi:hypothetical protein
VCDADVMPIAISTLLWLTLFVYCLFDVIATDRELIRNLPKLAWLAVVIILPLIGSVAWLVLGRPKGAALLPGTTTLPPRRGSGRPVAPDDDPEFLRQIRRPGDDDNP